MSDPLNVLIVSFEAVPFAKVGGLADVAGALPDALNKEGVDARLVMPRFGDIDPEAHELRRVDLPEDWFVGIDFEHHPIELWEGELPGGAPVWLIGDTRFFGRAGIYNGPGGQPFDDELERLVFFTKGVVEVLKCLDFKPDIVHLNDYQTALVAAYLRRLYVEEPRLAKPALVYSIHNLAYQGVFAADRLTTMGFEPALCEHPSPFEFHGNVNLMKIGIDLADVVNTVSPRYAEEIRGAEQGAGLEGLLDASADKLFGILNGIDTTIWDPATDPELPYAFHVDRMSGKRGCKAALLSEAGISLDRLDRPLFGMVGRLVAQKGVDLVLQVADELVGRDVGLIVLGSGASDLEEGLRALAARHPDRVGVRIGFDNGLAHRITAGADFFLMPSRYEPCGLNQMYAMRYGTIPIVKRTGGLADTVQHWNPVTHEGTGFLFDESEAVSMARAILSALEAYRDRAGWDQLRRNAMAQDFSWDRSAKDYINLYDEALCRHREP